MVLSASNPVLAAMFRHGTKESQTLVVEIEDISAEVFQQVLQYLYTGTAKKMKEMATELLVVADKYQIDPLKKECACALGKTLSAENAVGVLVLSHDHSCPDLQQYAMAFIAKNCKAVCARPEWMELMEKYPKLCFQTTKLMVGI